MPGNVSRWFLALAFIANYKIQIPIIVKGIKAWKYERQARQIAGMLLAYNIPASGHEESLENHPAFICPLLELEQCVPGSFYVNMLATYP